MNILDFLSDLGISYGMVEHPPVYTCAEAERLVPPLEAARTKNVFLRDRAGKRHFLVVVGYEKSVDLKALAPLLESSKLSLASPQRLREHLGVEPGSVTILGLANDPEKAVEFILDQSLAEAKALRCHPLVNTATLALSQGGLRRFLEATGHSVQIIDVPGRASQTAIR